MMLIKALDQKIALVQELLVDSKVVRNWIIFSLFFHLLAAIFSVGYHQHDEHWQILEFVGMKMGNLAPEMLSWEYQAKIRSGLQPFMAYQLSSVLSWFGVQSPYWLTFFLRLFSGVLAFGVSFWLLFSQMGQLKTELSQKIALVLTSLIWFIPYLHVRFASENWAALSFWAAFILLTQKPGAAIQSRLPRKATVLVAAFLLALAFLFRFAAGFMIAGLLLWMFFIEKNRKLEATITGALTVLFILGVGMPVDYWMYGSWTISGWNFFYIDIVQEKLASGISTPWHYYFPLLTLYLVPPYSIVLQALFFGYFVLYPRRSFTWATSLFFLVHVYIWHKEFRYISLLLSSFPVMVAFSLQYIELKYETWFQKLKSSLVLKVLAGLFVLLNTIAVFFASVKPANDKIYFFQEISQKYRNMFVVLLSYQVDVYKEKNFKMNFYKPHGLHETRLNTPDKMTAVLDARFQKGDPFVLLAYEGYEWPSGLEALQDRCVTTIRSVPLWTKSYNFFDWQSRTRIWNIAECKNAPGDPASPLK